MIPEYFRQQIPEKLFKRLVVERSVMETTNPYFTFSLSGATAYARGWYRSTIGRKYFLKLIFPDYYPDEIPKLYILTPRTLLNHDRSITLNDLGSSHEFHTLTSDKDGHLQICHYDSDNWHAACTSIGVMTKGLLWIEAYEDHLKTGSSIDTIINQWKRRKQWEETLKLKLNALNKLSTTWYPARNLRIS